MERRTQRREGRRAAVRRPCSGGVRIVAKREVGQRTAGRDRLSGPPAGGCDAPGTSYPASSAVRGWRKAARGTNRPRWVRDRVPLACGRARNLGRLVELYRTGDRLLVLGLSSLVLLSAMFDTPRGAGTTGIVHAQGSTSSSGIRSACDSTPPAIVRSRILCVEHEPRARETISSHMPASPPRRPSRALVPTPRSRHPLCG